jgi:hypothetical protein
VRFIESVLEYTKEYESPTSFWKWSIYAAIAGVLRDNVYKIQGDTPLYPNIYVLLLADSGIHRKGNPVRMCESMVRAVNNTKMISGRTSIQAILDELSQTETDRKSGKTLKGGSAIFCAQELSASIVADPTAVNILTDIYDYKNDFTSRLRGSGKFRIERMVFSMLGASNEDLLKAVYDTTAIRGGLLARTFLILPNEFRPSNALLGVSENGTEKQKLHIIDCLKKIGELAGEFTVDADAIEEYTVWYKAFRNSYKEKADKSGVVSRLHTGVLKLAMILAANDLRLVIKKEDIEQAIHECITLIPNYSIFIMGSGKSTIAECGTLVLARLLQESEHFVLKKYLLRDYWNIFTNEILGEFIDTATEAGIIQVDMINRELALKLTPKGLEMLQGNQSLENAVSGSKRTLEGHEAETARLDAKRISGK